MQKENLKYKFDGTGLTVSEKHQAKKLFNSYRDKYNIGNVSDLQLLSDLVYREILQLRYKTKIGEIDKNKKVGEIGTIIPRNILNALNDNSNQIIVLKEKLGLFEERKNKEDWLEYWGRLKKKLQVYAETHKGACTFKCPKCGEYALLLKKIDDYNTFNFNWFKGTFIYNELLMEEIEKKTLTIKRVSEIIGCSSEYIEGLYNKVYLEEKRRKEKTQ